MFILKWRYTFSNLVYQHACQVKMLGVMNKFLRHSLAFGRKDNTDEQKKEYNLFVKKLYK